MVRVDDSDSDLDQFLLPSRSGIPSPRKTRSSLSCSSTTGLSPLITPVARVSSSRARSSVRVSFNGFKKIEAQEQEEEMGMDEEHNNKLSNEDESAESINETDGEDKQNGSVRRSTRARVSRNSLLNESWILGGGPGARGYPSRNSGRDPASSTAVKQERTEAGGEQDYVNSTEGDTLEEEVNTTGEEDERESSDEVSEFLPPEKEPQNSFSALPAEEEIMGPLLWDLYTRVKGPGRRSRRIVNYQESQKSLDKLEEPVSKRLRRKGKKISSKSPQKRIAGIGEYRRKIQRRRRRKARSRSSSSDSSTTTTSECSQPTKRSKKNVSKYAMLLEFNGRKNKQGFSGDLQPLAIDPSTNFSSVGGLGKQIDKLKEMVIFPIIYKEFFTTRNITPARGILFHGPPGTGKTLLARALATEASKIGGRNVSFFMRKGADILNKWIGESERQLKLLFEQASLKQPSIIFFDEIDGLAPVRSSKTDQIHNSIVSTLLAEMDGLKDRGDVIVIGATNRIDSLDPALRRPGRFDHEFQFFLPSFEARKDILKVNLSAWETNRVSDDMLDELAIMCVGYSGADLKLLCAESSMCALRRRYPQIYTTNQKLILDYELVKVERRDWDQALSIVGRSTERSVFSSGFTALPLPSVLQPIFSEAVVAIRSKIDKIFPHELTIAKQASRKTFWLHTDCPVAGEHVIPAVLFGMDPRVPIHVLSVQAMAMKDASGSAVVLLFAEVIRRTSPSVIYIPSLDEVYNFLSPEGRIILKCELRKVVSYPVLIMASVHDSLPEDLSSFFDTEGVRIPLLSKKKIKEFFKSTFRLALDYRVPAPRVPVDEELQVAPPEVMRMSADEINRIERTENQIFRELRIFLREVIFKLARNRKFTEFTKPVDTVEVPDYLEIISQPMDLETMMVKVNQGAYHSARQFLEDIDLIWSNALNYNPAKSDTDRRLRHRAYELKDFAQTIIDAEMDSDFEESCQEIVRARVDRKREQADAEIELARRVNTSITPRPKVVRTPRTSDSGVRRKRRYKSSWCRGKIKAAKRPLLDSSKTQACPPDIENELLMDSEDMPLKPAVNSPVKVELTKGPNGKGVKLGVIAGISDADRKRYKDDLAKLFDYAVDISMNYSTMKLLEMRFHLTRIAEEHLGSSDKSLLLTSMKMILGEFKQEYQVTL